MKSSRYWENRSNQRMDLYQQRATEAVNEVNKAFKGAIEDINLDMENIMSNYALGADRDRAELFMSRDVPEHVASYYKGNIAYYRKMKDSKQLTEALLFANQRAYKARLTRAEAVKLSLQTRLGILESQQIRIQGQHYIDTTQEAFYRTMFDIQKGVGVGFDFAMISEDSIAEIVNNRWSGKHFSERVWANTGELATRLENTLLKGYMSGKSVKEMSKEIEDLSLVGQFASERLIRTETTYISNMAELQSYKEAGIEYYIFEATLDNRTSPQCRATDKKKYKVDEAQAGLNLPPLHPYCRSTTTAYFTKAIEDSIHRRAKDEREDKEYIIPQNMPYKDWEERFVNRDNNLSVTDVLRILNEEAKQKKAQKKAKKTAPAPVVDMKTVLLKSILEKNDFLTDNHKAEMREIFGNVDEDRLRLYDKMQDKAKGNNYYEPKTGHYAHYEKKIHMDMDSNLKERHLGNGRSGAWQTKVHEEFHQLDGMLYGTEFSKLPDGSTYDYGRAFTNPETVLGRQMADAILEDTVNTFNKAVDWMRATYEGASRVEYIKNLNRIPENTKKALVMYLKKHYSTNEAQARINVATDAFSLATEGRVTLYDEGFWGHNKAYNKDRGLAGATSETWANFGAIEYTMEEEGKNLIKGLMPKTWETYTEVLNKVVKYAKDNDIDYYKPKTK